MTPTDLATLLRQYDELEPKATPGPWYVKSVGHDFQRLTPVAIVFGDGDGFRWTKGDWEFVAFSRTAVPQLVADIREMRAREQRWQGECNTSAANEREMQAVLRVVMADKQRMREALEKMRPLAGRCLRNHQGSESDPHPNHVRGPGQAGCIFCELATGVVSLATTKDSG